MMEVITKEHECVTCHITFWITQSHNNRLLETKESFYCPNGHSQSYKGKSDAQQCREAKEESETRLKMYKNECEATHYLRDEIKGHKRTITKLKKKAGKKMKGGY